MIKNGKWRREEVHEYTFQITSLHLKIRYFRWLSKIFKHSEMWRFIWIKRMMSGFFLSSSSAVFCVIHLHVVCNVDVTESGGFYDWLIFHGLCHNLKKEVIVENQLLTYISSGCCFFACINKLDDFVERHLWLQSGYDIGHVMNGNLLTRRLPIDSKKVACVFTVYYKMHKI